MQKEKTSTVLIFFINGINSLLGWNAVLAALDYFANAFTQYNVYSFLPIPLFVGYITVGVSFHFISNRFKYINIIITGNSIVSISLIFLLIVSLELEQSTIGFVLILVCAFFIGIGANLSQLVFFAMINYLSQDVVSKFTVGTAVSGLSIAIIRATIVAIFGVQDTSSNPIIIYFIVALLINTLDIVMNIRFCRSSVYKHKIDHFLIHHDKEKQKLNTEATSQNAQRSMLEAEADSSSKGDEEPVSDAYLDQQTRIENQSYFRTLLETCQQIAPYPYIIMLVFVITFTLFPGPTFKKTFQGLNPTWSVIFFNIVYNIGDTTGKYSAQLKGAFNRQSLIFVFFSRLFFFLPITFMAMGADSQDPLTNNYVFPYVNQLLFSFTNGFCINASFIMAFQVCPLVYKKYAGVLCGLILQLGIIIGTIVQIPYSYLIGIN